MADAIIFPRPTPTEVGDNPFVLGATFFYVSFVQRGSFSVVFFLVFGGLLWSVYFVSPMLLFGGVSPVAIGYGNGQGLTRFGLFSEFTTGLQGYGGFAALCTF